MRLSPIRFATVLPVARPSSAAAQGQGCATVQWRINAERPSATLPDRFHTPEAVREWGDAGCRFGDPRDLSFAAGERGIVNDLLALKRRTGCPCWNAVARGRQPETPSSRA